MDEIVIFYPQGHAAHYEQGHPERPERVEVIRAELERVGWWDRYPHLSPVAVPGDILSTVHAPAYLNLLEMTCRRGGRLDMDTYTTPASWELAHKAVGGALATVESVWSGKSRRGMALTRPPGHHATRGQGMGFCLLNNVAVAAEHLLKNLGAQKIAIVDLDLHHGNGTQDIFWERGDVFYISTHQSPLYPGTGHQNEVGRGAGEGTTANFPFPPGSGDQAFLTVMDELILPLLDRYVPQMILISYGFDTHWSDPLGQLLLSGEGYAQLVSRLGGWADACCEGRVAVFLEGGYNLEAGSVCTSGIMAALLGESWQDPLGPSPYSEGSAWEGYLQRAKAIWQV